MRSAATILAASLIAGLLAEPVRAEVPLGGELEAEEACQAFVSIKNRTNPGDVETVPGVSYAVRGLNKEHGEWVHVVVPDAQPKDRWVHRDCGTLTAETGDDEEPPDRPEPTGFRPFFDTIDSGPNDPTPRPPALEAFDAAVLGVCGPWGSRPREAEFRAMLDREDLAADVAAIYEALGRRVGGGPVDLARFKDELTEAWFEEHGFAHIFCGEPSSGTIGGLHYRGRYLELQEKGLAGRMTERECRKTEIVPPVYTFGVEYKTPRGRKGEACPKGYPADLGARDLLIEATRAYQTMAAVTGKRMCLKPVGNGSGSGYFAVFVVKARAIRTFYPDATPRCDTGGPPASCACGS